MNPLTNMKNVKKLSEQELQTSYKTSWHDDYKDSAWIFIGGLPYDLTEGDLISVFSQYGEVANINLIRDKESGKSRGFCFLCYEDQRSTVLSVDNFNGIKLVGRTIRVDHVSDYKIPKDGKKTDEVTKHLHKEGCAPKIEIPKMPEVKPFVVEPQDLRETLVDQISADIKLPMRLPIYTSIKDDTSSIITTEEIKVKKEKKSKKEKKKKHKKKKSYKKKQSESSEDSSNSSDGSNDDKRKNRKRRHEDKHRDKEHRRHK